MCTHVTLALALNLLGYFALTDALLPLLKKVIVRASTWTGKSVPQSNLEQSSHAWHTRTTQGGVRGCPARVLTMLDGECARRRAVRTVAVPVESPGSNFALRAKLL